MTITKHELLADRLARILIHLYQGAVLTKEQLAEEFNVTTRTIYRDLGRLGKVRISHMAREHLLVTH
ncbi:TPA: HTH domain-containing protein [Aeromonas hydrophila]